MAASSVQMVEKKAASTVGYLVALMVVKKDEARVVWWVHMMVESMV
jgi:hypothetical protein